MVLGKIELLAVFIVTAFLAFIAWEISQEESERREFIAYCQDQGGSIDGCKWGYELMQNCEKSGSAIFVPMTLRIK